MATKKPRFSKKDLLAKQAQLELEQASLKREVIDLQTQMSSLNGMAYMASTDAEIKKIDTFFVQNRLEFD